MTIAYKSIIENSRLYGSRLDFYFEAATREDKKAGREFYLEAHSEAGRLARASNISRAQATGIIAALSVGTYYEKNIIDAWALCKYGENAIVSTYGSNLVKALDILDGFKSPLEALANKRYKKVFNFYHNILEPENCDYLTLDVWAVRALVNPLLHKNSARYYVNTARKYLECSKIYFEAASRHNVKPLIFQAQTWITTRRLYGRSVSFREVYDHVKPQAYYLGIGVN